jgi:hypothetical protein
MPQILPATFSLDVKRHRPSGFSCSLLYALKKSELITARQPRGGE